jgi:TatD DNase family protein
MIDTHCHLNFLEAFPDVPGTLARAEENGVDKVIVVGCDTETSERAVALAEAHPAVYACVGWHPTYAAKYTSGELQAIKRLAGHSKSVAIGEIGLDYHWDYSTPEQQRACTADHLDLAAELGLPVVFHCRDAYADLLDWLERLGPGHSPRILHCFSGSRQDAERAVRLGCYFGVDGPITYKKATNLREIVSLLPQDKLLLETDAPYLTPHPYRGKPNEPAMIPLINRALAETIGATSEQCAQLTRANSCLAFEKLC